MINLTLPNKACILVKLHQISCQYIFFSAIYKLSCIPIEPVKLPYIFSFGTEHSEIGIFWGSTTHTLHLSILFSSMKKVNYENRHQHEWTKKLLAALEQYFYLALGIAKYHCLCDGQSVIQVTQCVKFPFFSFHSNKELLNALQCQFITFHQDTDWIRHELASHFQYFMR